MAERDDERLGEQLRVCSFRLGEFLFAVPVDEVQEVLREQRITPVPRSDPRVLGLINLRGDIVTVLDLGLCLELPDCRGDRRGKNLILRAEGHPVSLQVDSVEAVQEISVADIAPVPGTLQGPVRELIRGACPLPDQLLLLLDAEAVVALQTSA